MTSAMLESRISFGNIHFVTSRPHSFGLVIDGIEMDGAVNTAEDYLHKLLLSPEHRDAFLGLIEAEGLVICKNVRSDSPSYRKVRGKSSTAKLSQAEYYHHDGCSSPTKPRVVEIRFPHQDVARDVATAIAPFPSVIRAMLMALPEHMMNDDDLVAFRDSFSESVANYPSTETWDHIQGKVTRMVRKEMGAEACRTYFRAVDQMACAYVKPWEMGESRLMLNGHQDLTRTFQHRRAYQRPREALEQNGSLVKRWTAEEA